MVKKAVIFLFSTLFCVGLLKAEHIKGGEMYYTYNGPGPTANTNSYTVTLKLYIDCKATSPGQLDTAIPFTVFNKDNGQQYGDTALARLAKEQFINFDPASNPCISNAPTDVCYRIRWFTTIVVVPINNNGYTIAYQRCCRVANIVNLVSPSGNAGSTYTAELPGSVVYPEAYKNNSPQFVTNDVAAICANSAFTFSFAAVEIDGDSLSYSLCGGYTGGSTQSPAPIIASQPPYTQLNYQFPFSGTSPLGASSTINPVTGLITGIAPGVTGQYVITACAYEYRKGVLINVHRKDIHVAVSNCIPLKAYLDPNYVFCDDLKVSFKNNQINPAGSSYIWTYGDGSKADTTLDPTGAVTHQYADSGTYTVKLKVILAGGQCVDSATTSAKVYPGFYPGFIPQGTCILFPIPFQDTTKSRYGAASKWSWNFGDETTTADTSHQQNPSWKYSTTGFKTVQLIVESTKGCIDTATAQVEVRDKPPINLPFKDTLICSIDTLKINASGNGIFSWSPNYNIINANSATPSVFPKLPTWYYVSLNENGCVNNDSLRVRVVDTVTLFAGNDTTICAADSIRLNPSGDGLQFVWTPATAISNANVKNPIVFPSTTTVYKVTAIIGKCRKDDDLTVKTVPYPTSIAGPDSTICFDDTAQLNASIVGSRFVWSPTSTLSNPSILNPLAFPTTTTTYTLYAYDTLGCPKPGISQITVNVRNKIIAFAGNDTSVVISQPLQLNGSGGILYQWAPSTNLNNAAIKNPIAILSDNFTYIMRAYTPEGCEAYDTINIKVFKTLPDIFVPNAFVPGGKNRLLRPIPVGIAQFDFFRVYNRWGQLVFQTSNPAYGWDGTIGGKTQDTGTYVWMAQGVDYTGRKVFRKGTATLIH